MCPPERHDIEVHDLPNRPVIGYNAAPMGPLDTVDTDEAIWHQSRGLVDILDVGALPQNSDAVLIVSVLDSGRVEDRCCALPKLPPRHR